MNTRQFLSAGLTPLLAAAVSLFSNTIHAQISPGELTKAHAPFEGVANCTKCHELGDKVLNSKCLDCHQEIKSRLDKGKGYHTQTSVRSKDCFSCHSEHHGRSFEIVRFDKKTFDHQQTGYALTGAHLRVDCAACHKPEFVVTPDLKANPRTYLGLSTECAKCHTDVHQATLSRDCATCHTTATFSPAGKFDHARTDFPLRGKHLQTECVACHQKTVRAGRPFQAFAGTAFSSCVNCHDDPHNKRLGGDCKACHQESGFRELIGKITFNHSKTRFPLQGQHRRVDCATCHTGQATATPSTVYREYANKDIDACTACHKDVHEGKFGQTCTQCHTVESFRQLVHTDQFDHRLTGWPLEGKHKSLDCKACHTGSYTTPVSHQTCTDCHQDGHQGQFTVGGILRDCAGCHTAEGFAGSTFSTAQHEKTLFPLTGAHLATPCFACHVEKQQWRFRDIGQRCADCHTDVHAGALNARYYPEKACDRCHNTAAWPAINFDHGQTDFALAGRHRDVDCRACHRPDDQPSPKTPIQFSGVGTACAGCHANIHGRQFVEKGVTDCAQCHAPQGWAPSTFDHNTARFRLEGKHADLACAACHSAREENGEHFVLYATGKISCADCHQ